MPTMRTANLSYAAVLVLLGSGSHAIAQSNENRGLWVGEVKLSYANEVTVPLDNINNPIAPKPKVPTPTFDDASLRLILHVNGAGQVNLLRDVALIRRKPGVLGSENDIALVTDERLYGEFPPQPARRIASAVFDFGDARATAAVDAVVDAAITAAYSKIGPLTRAALNTSAKRDAQETVAFTAAKEAAPAVISSADATTAFNTFLTAEFNLAAVDSLAAGGDSAALVTAATALKEGSFYGDGRGTAMVAAVSAAITEAKNAEPPRDEQAAARAAAAAFADINNDYQRFIAGEQVGDMITSAAKAAGVAAAPFSAVAITDATGTAGVAPVEITAVAHGLQDGARVVVSDSTITALNGTHSIMSPSLDTFEIDVPFTAFVGGEPLGAFVPIDTLAAAVNDDRTGSLTKAEALRIQVAAYSDTRAVTAVDTLRAAMVDAAERAAGAAGVLTNELRERRVRDAVLAAGHEALAEDVARFALPAGAPSADYTNFVRSDIYAGSAETAARAVAAAMIEEKANNILANEASIKGQARAAALRALKAVYSTAAISSQTTLAMQDGGGGGFGVGNGDARLTFKLGDGEVLAEPALTATLVLPASHPTNPFRHSRHPDHTRGFDIRREIRLDFNPVNPGAADRSPSPLAGYGVDRLSGVFREEIFGLHKPLGPDPDNDPVGLRVEGTFELYRVSLIDTLNAR